MNGELYECPVRVCVRCRPISDDEELRGAESILQVENQNSVHLNNDRRFTFDSAYGPSSSQQQIFDDEVCEIIDRCLEGYNGTILAYGQTGSGKTYTMGMDPEAVQTDLRDEVIGGNVGMVPRICMYLFKHLKNFGKKYRISMTYVEVYNENVKDLLSRENHAASLPIRETKTGVMIQGATEVLIQSATDVMKQVQVGAAIRSVGATNMNAKSSRSHAILTIIIAQTMKNGVERTSKLHLVDLAGSERNKRTQAVGTRFQESIQINQGLLALGNVISALGANNTQVSHIPYRQSKLTRLLQDSLGGNSCTLFIACISGADDNLHETLNTLKYANRARQIQNTVTVNEAPAAFVPETPTPTYDYHENLLELFQECQGIKSSTDAVERLVFGLREIFQSHEISILEDFPMCQCSSLQADLDEANANLDRDEVIFSNKMLELQNQRELLEALQRDNETAKKKISLLEEENIRLLDVELSPLQVATDGAKSPAQTWRSCSLDSPLPDDASVESEENGGQNQGINLAEIQQQILQLQETCDNQSKELEEARSTIERLTKSNASEISLKQALEEKIKQKDLTLEAMVQQLKQVQSEARTWEQQLAQFTEVKEPNQSKISDILTNTLSRCVMDWKETQKDVWYENMNVALDQTMSSRDFHVAKNLLVNHLAGANPDDTIATDTKTRLHKLEMMYSDSTAASQNSNLAETLLKQMVPRVNTLTSEEKTLVLEALCSRIAMLEIEKTKFKCIRTYMHMKIQEDENIIDDLESQVDTLTQKYEDLETSSAQQKKPSLDEKYLVTLERDVAFYKKSVADLQRKAERTNMYKTQLANLKTEYANLKQHMQVRGNAVMSHEVTPRAATPPPPGSVKISRGQLAEIDIGSIARGSSKKSISK